jgi:hypothetical protein
MLNEFICIGLICISIKSFYDAYKDPNQHIDLDHYPILEYSRSKAKYVPVKENVVHAVQSYKSKAIVKTTPPPQLVPKQIQESKNADGYTQLQQDCLDALKALGVKTKKERTFIVHTTFNKHNPTTIQEFLQLALIRGS